MNEMTHRERWDAILSGKPFDRLPLMNLPTWGETLMRWRAEGLGDRDRDATLGLTDRGIAGVRLNMNMVPEFEVRVLSKDAEHVVLVDEYGVTKMLMRTDFDRSEGRKKRAGDTSAMSHWIAFPVKARADWERIRDERFQPTLDGRLPPDWNQGGREEFIRASRDLWVVKGSFPFGGLFSALRELMGIEGTFYTVADDPEFVKSILSDLTSYYLELMSRYVGGGVRVDQMTFFEDMCSTQGPLMSPAMFRELIAPCYRRLIGGLREMGVRHFIMDTDGNARPIVPELIAAGLTGMLPCQVQSGMGERRSRATDVAALRRDFPNFALIGGIDKRALALGPKEIEADLDRCFAVAWTAGRYVPWMDHGAPPDISWANAQVYAELYRARCLSSPATA